MTNNGHGHNDRQLADLLAFDSIGVAGHQQALKVRLDLFEETVFMTRYKHGQPSRVMEVSPLDLAAAFADVAVATPVLPRGCLFWARKEGKERLGIYLPPRLWSLQLEGRQRVARVPLPGLVLVGHGRAYQLWAIKHPLNDGIPTQGWQPCATDRLYKAPLPNINPGHGGGVCQGSAAREFPLASTDTISKAVGALFDSAWSDHWVDNKSLSHPRDVRKMYPRAHRLGHWPQDDLVPIKYTLGDVTNE